MRNHGVTGWPTIPSVVYFASLCIGLILFCGCGAQKPRITERDVLPPHPVPSNLQVEHLERGISLSWRTNRRSGNAISGYQIYISPEKSIRELSPNSPEGHACRWRSMIYPGDTDPRTDIETAQIIELEYGVLYYIHVRTVDVDGSVGPPSEEITVIPRPSGRIEMVPRHVGKRDGYSFAERRYVRSRDEINDLYLFVRNDSVFAASPHRLEQFMRYVEFHEIGPSKSVDEYPIVEISGKGETKMLLREGITYILSTPENCRAKFRVAGITGTGGQTVVTMDYIYQPRYGSGIF
jgi:hypothetical protein